MGERQREGKGNQGWIYFTHSCTFSFSSHFKKKFEVGVSELELDLEGDRYNNLVPCASFQRVIILHFHSSAPTTSAIPFLPNFGIYCLLLSSFSFFSLESYCWFMQNRVAVEFEIPGKTLCALVK